MKTRALTKTYGATTALAGIDLDVPPGTIYGLVGPNGSGKTTALGILAGLRRPTSGRLELDPGTVAYARTRRSSSRG